MVCLAKLDSSLIELADKHAQKVIHNQGKLSEMDIHYLKKLLHDISFMEHGDSGSPKLLELKSYKDLKNFVESLDSISINKNDEESP